MSTAVTFNGLQLYTSAAVGSMHAATASILTYDSRQRTAPDFAHPWSMHKSGGHNSAQNFWYLARDLCCCMNNMLPGEIGRQHSTIGKRYMKIPVNQRARIPARQGPV